MSKYIGKAERVIQEAKELQKQIDRMLTPIAELGEPEKLEFPSREQMLLTPNALKEYFKKNEWCIEAMHDCAQRRRWETYAEYEKHVAEEEHQETAKIRVAVHEAMENYDPKKTNVIVIVVKE